MTVAELWEGIGVEEGVVLGVRVITGGVELGKLGVVDLQGVGGLRGERTGRDEDFVFGAEGPLVGSGVDEEIANLGVNALPVAFVELGGDNGRRGGVEKDALRGVGLVGCGEVQAEDAFGGGGEFDVRGNRVEL